MLFILLGVLVMHLIILILLIVSTASSVSLTFFIKMQTVTYWAGVNKSAHTLTRPLLHAY